MHTTVLYLQQYYKSHELVHVSGLIGPSSGSTIIVYNGCLVYWSFAFRRTVENSLV